MAKKPVPLAIDVRIDGTPSTELIAAIRAATGKSLLEIKEQLKQRAPVYSAVLVPEAFYSGIKELLSFIAALETLGVRYVIESNGEKINKAVLDRIKYQVDHISFEDFR